MSLEHTMPRHEARRRRDHADCCMEEAGIITVSLAGLGLMITLAAHDVGLGHLASWDGQRALVWTALGVGMYGKRPWPALLLLMDLVVRTAWQVGIGEPPFLPSVLAVGALSTRALLAALAADEAAPPLTAPAPILPSR